MEGGVVFPKRFHGLKSMACVNDTHDGRPCVTHWHSGWVVGGGAHHCRPPPFWLSLWITNTYLDQVGIINSMIKLPLPRSCRGRWPRATWRCPSQMLRNEVVVRDRWDRHLVPLFSFLVVTLRVVGFAKWCGLWTLLMRPSHPPTLASAGLSFSLEIEVEAVPRHGMAWHGMVMTSGFILDSKPTLVISFAICFFNQTCKSWIFHLQWTKTFQCWHQ